MSQVDLIAATFDVHERAVMFGSSGGLIGIVTEPVERPDSSASSGPPALVFINTGIIHRVGESRMSTIWARRLAKAGKTALRFDLSGIGDSERRDDNLPILEATLADIREAVDWLETHRGSRRFILIGLCMGADRALVYAGTDPRIVGAVLIDPTIPPTWRYYVLRYFRAVLDPRSWQRQLEKQADALKVLHRWLRGNWRGDGSETHARRRAVRAFFAAAYQAAIAGNVRILAVFTEGFAFQYNYRDQLIEAFPGIAFDKHLQIEYFKKADHSFSLEADRHRLFEVTEAWLASSPFEQAPGTLAEPRDSMRVGGDSPASSTPSLGRRPNGNAHDR